MGARILMAAVRGYQRWVSPALGPRCRFYPSCSAYALQALELHRAFRGTLLAVWRLARCQPFHPGGVDHVPPPGDRLRAPRRQGEQSRTTSLTSAKRGFS